MTYISKFDADNFPDGKCIFSPMQSWIIIVFFDLHQFEFDVSSWSDAGSAFLAGIPPQWCVLLRAGGPWYHFVLLLVIICLGRGLLVSTGMSLCSYVSCVEEFWNTVSTPLLLHGFPDHCFFLSYRVVLGMSSAALVSSGACCGVVRVLCDSCVVRVHLLQH